MDRRGTARFALLVALAPVAATAVAATAAETPCSWAMYGRDPAHSFAQSADCSLITPANAATLGVKWFIPTGAPVTASPSVVGGFVYVGDWDGRFYKIDAETGEIAWTFQVDDTHRVPFGRIVSSAAVDALRVDGETVPVVLFGGGATLYALDPASGALLAKQDVDPRDAATRAAHQAAGFEPEIEIESSPVVAHFARRSDDRVFVGMDVHNDAGVGRTGLLSLRLRKEAQGATPYRFELVYKFDPETRLLRRSFTEGSGTGFGCGGVWSSPALDASALRGDGVIVFGTSNCHHPEESFAAGEAGREGVFAIRARTGELLWEFHPRPPNHLDDDFGASPNLLPGGAVGNGGKDGWYYAFDLLRGAERWRSHPAQSGHLEPDFAFGGIIGTPAVGEVRGEPAVFIASALSTAVGDPGPPPLPDPTLAEDPGRMRSLHAIRAADGALLWRSSLVRPSFGAPTFARGVLFVPSTLDLSVKAFDVNALHPETGEPLLLWEHPLDGAPSSSPTIVWDSIYLGAGTTAEGLPLEQASGIWAFELAPSPVAPSAGLLLSAQANQLDLYALGVAAPGGTRSTPIPPASAGGNDVNGQICRITQASGETLYVMGEDTNQAVLPRGSQGWGLFRATNGVAGPWQLVDKLVPPYNFSDPPNDHLPDNTGCAISADGSKLFLVDLGVGAFDAPGVGSLFVFFRDRDGDFSGIAKPAARRSKLCVLDRNLTTAGYIAVDDDGSVLVPESGRSSGGVISRFAPPFPPDGASCSLYDLAGQKSEFIRDPFSFVPISIARRGSGWIVGNVVPGMINEYDADGRFARPIVLGAAPGVAGVGVDAAGNVYFADLGLVPHPEELFTPGDHTGSVSQVPFDPVTDHPLPPVPIQTQLDFPEGIAVFPSLTP